MEIRETVSQYTQARMRIEPPAAARAEWLSPARRRGRGMFSLGAVRAQVPGGIVVETAEEALAQSFFPVMEIQRDLLVLGYMTADQMTGINYSHTVPALQQWNREMHPYPYCVNAFGLCYAMFPDFPMVTGHDAEIRMGNLWRGLLKEDADIIRMGGEFTPGRPLPPAERGVRHEDAPAEPGVSPRMQTDALRYGLLALGVVGVGAVGYMIWRRSR